MINVEPDSIEISQIAEKINAVLRYTFVLPFETYTKDFHKAVEKLRKSGYQIPESKIWNAWENIGTKFDRGYRGINITIISSKNQTFELQFHTAESFALKTETHNLYEKLRTRKVSEKSEIELIEKLRKAAAVVQRPKGV